MRVLLKILASSLRVLLEIRVRVFCEFFFRDLIHLGDGRRRSRTPRIPSEELNHHKQAIYMTPLSAPGFHHRRPPRETTKESTVRKQQNSRAVCFRGAFSVVDILVEILVESWSVIPYKGSDPL